MARKPLGRGLSALLGDDKPANLEAKPAGESEIAIDLIDPNPDQPRTRFADKALDELAQSISVNGIVQPVVVRPVGGRYQIVAGERRWRAAQRAGLRKIPVVVKEVADDKLLELALIENIQRQELNPIEEATAYKRLIESVGLTQEKVAERVGKERSLIATSLRLLKLPNDIQGLIEEEKLSAGHGRALLMTDDKAVQRRIARNAIEKGLSVRETEKQVKKTTGKATTVASKEVIKTPKDPNVRLAETKLMRKLGTNVKIQAKGDGVSGKIEIEYYSLNDFDRIFEIVMKDKK